jgi:hypothetical protein
MRSSSAHVWGSERPTVRVRSQISSERSGMWSSRSIGSSLPAQFLPAGAWRRLSFVLAHTPTASGSVSTRSRTGTAERQNGESVGQLDRRPVWVAAVRGNQATAGPRAVRRSCRALDEWRPPAARGSPASLDPSPAPPSTATLPQVDRRSSRHLRAVNSDRAALG